MSLKHLSNGSLRTKLTALVATDCTTTADLLEHLGEYDARRLCAEDGYPSTFAYCVSYLRFSEDMAFKRIRAARACRRFPSLLKAIADGGIHLTGAVLLAPVLTAQNVRELIAAATHKTRKQIELLLAERYPRPDVATVVRALPILSAPKAPSAEVVPEPVILPAKPESGATLILPAPPSSEVVPEPVVRSVSRVAPLAPCRFSFQTAISQETHDKLQRLQELLGHALPSGDVAEVLDRAFDALLEKLEKAKHAATNRPRCSSRTPSQNPRHIPAHVKRRVWKRDGGRCTFVTAHGQRCEARKFLEYDHVLEVARGGTASVTGIRLLCRTHNQYMSEQTFGAGFMRARREATKAGGESLDGVRPD